MKLFLLLAWRNLWRNRRRTFISTASVFFAVLFSLVMRSMQNGSYDYMIQSAVGLYLGYVQVHGEGYWDKRSLDYSMELNDNGLAAYRSVRHVTHVTPRLETFALLSRDSLTKVSQITGIDPERENAMTGLAARLVQGRYLKADDEAALIGEGLAGFLGAHVGDSIVVYGQGFHGVTAAARVRVAGILHFPIPDLNNSITYLPLKYSQWLFSAPDRITAVAIMIDNPTNLDGAESSVRAMAGPGTEVMDWETMMPELVQSIQVDSAGGVIMLVILYVVIGFGIFGTVMMMTAERQREFGVLISVGMKRWKLMTVTTLETIMVSLLGALAGVLAGIPLLGYLSFHPIPLTGDAAKAMLAYGLEPMMPFSAAAGIFLAQASVVFVLAAVCALYPCFVIRSLKPVSALRT